MKKFNIALTYDDSEWIAKNGGFPFWMITVSSLLPTWGPVC
jgi:hypothetical protein